MSAPAPVSVYPYPACPAAPPAGRRAGPARRPSAPEAVPPRKPLRIFVDHGEAYGNLGDEAMLINALRRLDERYAPCEFVLPCAAGAPLPAALPPVTRVESPLATLTAAVGRLRRRLRGLARMGRGVLGDDVLWRLALLRAGLALLPELAPMLRVRLWPGHVSGFGAALRRVADALSNCDVFYAVGAADLSDHWPAGVIYKEWLYRLARRLTPVVVISAQGVGPLLDRRLRRRAGRALQQGHIVSFRDYDLSRRLYLESGAIDGSNGAVVADEAFSLPPAPLDAARGLLAAAGLPDGRPFVAVHFRATDYTRRTHELTPRLAGLLDRLAGRTRGDFVFIPMSYAAHSGVDREVGQSIRARMTQPERLVLLPECRDVQLLKSVVGLARYTLGLSYHVHVFAFSQGRPGLILYTGGYYRAKSDGLIGFYGRPSAALDLDRTTDAAIVSAVDALEADYEAACGAIRRVNEQLRTRHDWTLNALDREMQVRGWR